MQRLVWSMRFSALLVVLLVLGACSAAPAARPAPVPTAPAASSAPTAPAAQGAPSGVQAAVDEQAAADFYRGKTVRILVGFAAGGGYDAYSRLIGRHLRQYIPGNPAVIVENMPGAGSILAANHLYKVGPKDGTLIGNISGPIVLEQLFGAQGVEFDMARFRYLFVPTPEAYQLVVTRKAGVTRIDEVLGANAKEIVVGGIPGSTVEHAAILMRDALGAKIRLVSGYDGTSKVRLAMDSGEVDGFFNTWQSTKVTSREKFESGEWLVLATLADRPIADWPNVPAIPDIARTEDQRQILRYGTYVPNQVGKIYAVHGEVPADRAAALERAFSRMMADPDFIAEADKASLDFEPIYGEEIQNLMAELLAMPADIRGKLQDVMKPQGR
jgi:tripartite-type tricarboxylate transporter receptor subunit TctC